jgi:hypothetical protein
VPPGLDCWNNGLSGAKEVVASIGHQIELREGTTPSIRIDLEPLFLLTAKVLFWKSCKTFRRYQLTGLILQNAEGVPFYVEELQDADDGVIDTHSTDWQVDRSRLVRVPTTLMEVLQARFDSLSFREPWAWMARCSLPDLPDPANLPFPPLLLRRIAQSLRAYSSVSWETREFFFKHGFTGGTPGARSAVDPKTRSNPWDRWRTN